MDWLCNGLILYWVNKQPHIATRGSFNSEQSIKANEILQAKYSSAISNLDESCTYIFEIIYPENRIVVDYGANEDLILLAIIETKSGKEKKLIDLGFPLPQKYDFKNITEMLALNWPNYEGFVLKYENGFRVKIKFEEYVEIHSIITQVSSLSIWKALKEKGSLDDFIINVPDEFYDWVKETEKSLLFKFNQIENLAKNDYKELETRKETALYFQTCKYPAVLFCMYNKIDYSKHIWGMIRPVFEKAFSNPKTKFL